MTLQLASEYCCEAPGCRDEARLLTFYGSAQVMRVLGFVVDADGLSARLCLRHYLIAMSEVLARANRRPAAIPAKAQTP
jgi:hypothetical protein